MWILFVEDEPIISMVGTEALEEAGHEVLAAYTADDAIECIISTPRQLSCLITDFNMPGRLNGVDLVNWVRVRYPNIPVILATALGHTIDRPWLDRRRVILMDKPYSPASLVEMVQRLLAAA